MSSTSSTSRCSTFWFGQVNSRPLSLFRLGIALLLLKEALLHLPLNDVFYSDSGVLPRAVLWTLPQPHQLSLLSLFDALPDGWMAACLFSVWAVVAFLLLIGFRTRLMTIFNFLIIASVHARNPYLLSGADTLLRLLSFWMIFIPLDHAYTWRSLQKWRLSSPHPALDSPSLNSEREQGGEVNAFPVRLLQIQVALVYLMAGLFKLLGEHWRDGSALSDVLQLGSWLRPTGNWLSANAPDGLLRVTTYLIIALELAFAFLVFAPFWQPKLRYLAIASAALMHLGIALVMTTPLLDFVFVFSVSYLIFLPSPIPTASAPPRHPLWLLAPAALMLCVFWQNADDLRQLGITGLPALPTPIEALLYLSGLHQNWQLFSPMPVQIDSAIVIPGTFSDQIRIDLQTGKPPAATISAAPTDIAAYRWIAFNLFMVQSHPASVLDAWSRYLCRRYNTPEGTQSGIRLVTLQIRALTRRVHAPGQKPNPLQDDLLWLHACSAEQ